MFNIEQAYKFVTSKHPFVSSSTSGGILDKSIEAEEKKHGDFLRLVCSFSFLFLAEKKN